MSNTLACITPWAQAPDSLAAATGTQEPAAQPHAEGTAAAPHAPTQHARHADSLRHETRTPHTAIQDPQAPQDSLAAQATCPVSTPSLPPQPFWMQHEPAGPDSHKQALGLLHFQESDESPFSNSPYWHPELPPRPTGFPCRHLPYRVSTDSHTACALLVCFLMLVYMLTRYGSEMRTQMHDFFLPTRIRQGHRQGLGTAQGLLSMPYVCLMLSVMGSIGVSVIEQDSLGWLSGVGARLAVQGFYTASWLCFFFGKINSYAFINWIFFNKQARREWHDTLFLILSLEATLLFPVLLLAVYMRTSPQVFVWSILSVIMLAKALLLYKAYSVFSVKIYGALHLFVYFCTLEVAPLWVALKILTRITDLL